MSRQKIDWPGIFYLVRWYVLRKTKAAAARMPIHGLELSTYVYCRLYISYVQDYLALNVFFIWLSSPVDSLGKQIQY